MRKIGMLNIFIDQLVPCLISTATNQKVETYVQRVINKDELKGLNSKTDWYVNWSSMLKDHMIFKLMVKGNPDIQGLAAVHNDTEAQTMFFDWAVSNPKSNKVLCNRKGVKQEYLGIGGHLFAIAVNASMEAGYDGIILGHPANAKLMDHYIKKLEAESFPISYGHQYTIVIWEEAAKKIKEVYDYEFIE